MMKVPGTIAVLLVAALLAGCGGDAGGGEGAATTGGSSGASSDAGGDRAAQYAACMRKNGVPEFPDPENGETQLRVQPGSGLDPNSPEFKAAQKACQDLAPQGGQAGGAPDASVQKKVLAFAKCMRQNGVPDFPDPEVSGGHVTIGGAGADPNSPQFQQAQQACQGELAGLGGK